MSKMKREWEDRYAPEDNWEDEEWGEEEDEEE